MCIELSNKKESGETWQDAQKRPMSERFRCFLHAKKYFAVIPEETKKWEVVLGGDTPRLKFPHKQTVNLF